MKILAKIGLTLMVIISLSFALVGAILSPAITNGWALYGSIVIIAISHTVALLNVFDIKEAPDVNS